MSIRQLALIIFLPLFAACASLERDVAATMAGLDADGASYGLLVTTLDGEEIVAVNPDKRFLPASNVKLITTAAAFDRLGPMDQPDAEAGAAIYLLATSQDAAPALVLVGHGDARLSDGPDCETDCLTDLADAIEASGVSEFSELMVYDALMRDAPWAHGWSWEDLTYGYGAAASGLNLNDNIITLTIAPAETPGAPALLSLGENAGYFPLRNDVVTVAGGEDSDVRVEREPGSRWIRAHGRIAADASARSRTLGLEDPPHFTGWRLMKHLEARGIALRDGMSVWRGPPPLSPAAVPLIQLAPPPLVEDLAIINKASNNLHAEVLLRRLGRIEGDGSVEDGVETLHAIVEAAAAPRAGYDLYDGSGMSIYNRLSPQAVVALLLWADDQPWGDAYRDTLAVAGVDGTLKRRFLDGPLTGKLAAKSGALNGANALSGYMRAASGETLVFAYFVNDRASISGSALDEMEAVLIQIAAAN